jgi:hypothetical protein
MRRHEGLGERPAGSNRNEITEWYGMDGPWCAMTVSRALCDAGFTTDGDDVVVPGVRTTTAHGWAYVPYMLNDFRDAGRADGAAHAGDIVIFDWDDDGFADHVGLVERVEADGTVWTYEGNRSDELQHVHRDPSVILAYCHPPYDDGVPSRPVPRVEGNAPAFPGYCSLGSTGTATRQVQQRLVDRGWQVEVDGVFGHQTDATIRTFQGEKGLEIDGVVGPITWSTLWTSPIT